MNKDLMLKNLGESEIIVKYKAEWIGGDHVVKDASLDFFKTENYDGYISYKLSELSSDNRTTEGVITLPSTHIYGQIAGGDNAYVGDESVGVEVIVHLSTPKFKLTSNNVYLVAQIHSGY